MTPLFNHIKLLYFNMGGTMDFDKAGIPEAERERVKRMLRKLMELGIGAVYGVEDPDETPADVDCAKMIKECRALCCTFVFAQQRTT